MKSIALKMFIILAFPAFLLSCDSKEKDMSPAEYAGHIAEWDLVRLQGLKSPTGWVNLAGLFWLEEGENSAGAAGTNDKVFPRGPEQIGVFILNGENVTFTPSGEVKVLADGDEISGTIKIFGRDSDAELLTVDSLGFFIIQRGERTGIRLRDYIHPRLDELQYIDRYPPDQDWIVKAKFVEPEEELIIRVPDVLGEINEEKPPGILEFDYQGNTYRLYPTGSKDRLFIIFADDTNALETYGGGRFLSADGPGRDGFVYIDFNKAYNPPCAFSPWATCPLPPRENFLPFAVTAGEKASHY
ncbi:MAG: DUF1684 domain-containing protein [Bacteroidales bacterium]